MGAGEMAQGEECTLLLEDLSLVPSTQPVTPAPGLQGGLWSPWAPAPTRNGAHANTHNLTKSLKECKSIQSGFS